jgi:hypothetical protein
LHFQLEFAEFKVLRLQLIPHLHAADVSPTVGWLLHKKYLIDSITCYCQSFVSFANKLRLTQVASSLQLLASLEQ